MKRNLDIVVISDIHLGSSVCQAKELLNYLTHIEPKILILNGNIVDIDNIKKKSFPSLHFKIIQEVMKMANEGTKVYYIMGNQDDIFKTYANFSSGNIFLRDKLVLRLKDKKYWFFHGDVLDTIIKYSTWLKPFSGKSYRLLLWFNRRTNAIRTFFNLPKVSISKKIKKGSSSALKYIKQFEDIALQLAEQQNHDYVICGHIHQAKMRVSKQVNKQTIYMNSGDWVESLTALEYQWGRWSIYEYDEMDYHFVNPKLHVRENSTEQVDNADSILKDIKPKNAVPQRWVG